MSSELKLYFQTSIFSAVIFGITYWYITWLGIPNALNKSVADTGIILMGWSMLLSSVCYFWNFLDKMIIYRKYLGLVGFAFGVVHLILSWGAFLRLFSFANWQNGILWAPLAGTLAFIIFLMMTLISNKYMIGKLGGKLWKQLLRTGYVAVIFVAIHVIALRWGRWMSWAEEGFNSPPSMSLLVTVFTATVVLMRIALWIALKNRKKTVQPVAAKVSIPVPTNQALNRANRKAVSKPQEIQQ